MYALNNGVKIWYEVHGQGEPTIVMVPGFQIAHSEGFTQTYVNYLARHMRVITLDLRGSGKSDKPDNGYDIDTYVEDIHSVAQAAGIDRFAMAGYSCGSLTTIKYYITHPDTITHLILISGYAKIIKSDKYPHGMSINELNDLVQFWKEKPELSLQGFIDRTCSEKYTLRLKELINEWAHETPQEIWCKGFAASVYADVDNYLSRIHIPVLIIHGEKDKIIFYEASEYLARKIPNAKLITFPEAGHSLVRVWPQICIEIHEFLSPRRSMGFSSRKSTKTKNILWISSPIGLGHVKRDLEIVNEIRKKIPDIAISWLSIDPVRSLLEKKGETIHPFSSALWNEGDYFENQGSSYSLDASEAYWKMNKLLNNNFMIFIDAIFQNDYDLIVGDESWEIAEYLHYNPSLKIAPFVFITDFIGISNIGDDTLKNAHVYNTNATWVEMHDIHPEACDVSLFVGEPLDIPDKEFGEGLPNRREWAKKYFNFTGYILTFDPADYSDREKLRTDLGFSLKDKIFLVALGGTSLGYPLVEKTLEAVQLLKNSNPDIKVVILCGPRIDYSGFAELENVVFKPYVQDPIQYFAVSDLAVIQGGLCTAMELTALQRPFIYFPLKDHFEQQDHVNFRLKRYNAGIHMDFHDTSPSQLADSIMAKIGSPVSYKPVITDGAKKAANMIMEIIR